MIRTFPDSGVLISAARGEHAESEPARRVLEDPKRRFLTSVFVRLVDVEVHYNLPLSTIVSYVHFQQRGRQPVRCRSGRLGKTDSHSYVT